MKVKFFSLFSLLILVISANVTAQGHVSNEIDLKAGYCIAAVKAGTGSIPADTGKLDPLLIEFIQQRNAQLSKLLTFLKARSQSMSLNTIIEFRAAVSAGEDAHKRDSAAFEACVNETITKSGRFTDANMNAAVKMVQDCRIRKLGESEVRRLEQCNSLDFLPY